MSREAEIKFSVDEFNKSLDQYYRKVATEDAKTTLIGVAMEALGEFMRLTPVDTGTCLGGWYPAARELGIPIVERGEGGDKKNKKPEEGSITFSFGGTVQYIEISNRVHYAIYLEFGRSRKAPQGMVRRTLAKMQAKLDAGSVGR